MIRLTNRFVQMLIGAGLLHALWVIISALVNSSVFPQPWLVYGHLPQEFSSGIVDHLLVSLGRIAQGIGCSLILALILALLIYKARRVGYAIESFIYLSYPIPKLALLPVIMLLAGLGEMTKVTMIVLIILFQLVVSIRDSLRAIDRASIATLRSLGASAYQEVRYLLFPAIVPDILSALRIAIGTAISVLFVTETYGTSQGMGYYIVDAWMRIAYLDMYSGIVMLGAMGFVLFVLVDVLEYLFCQWRR